MSVKSLRGHRRNLTHPEDGNASVKDWSTVFSFHATGGREGLTDIAVKTVQAGHASEPRQTFWHSQIVVIDQISDKFKSTRLTRREWNVSSTRHRRSEQLWDLEIDCPGSRDPWRSIAMCAAVLILVKGPVKKKYFFPTTINEDR